MKVKDYITQLTREDLREIAAAVNPQPGNCIRIEKDKGQLKISVDENALKTAIVAVVHNLGLAPYAVQPTMQQITECPLYPNT